MEAGLKRIPNWALVVACVLPFLGFWAYGLFDLDEGFYGAVVVDMIRRGDWVTPTLNGQPWFEKPILAYWLAVPSVSWFGEAVGPRLPSVLCTLATALVLFRFVRRHLDDGVARLAVLVYCTNLLVVGIGRMMMTDALLVLCLTLALTTFWESISPPPTLPSDRDSEASSFLAHDHRFETRRGPGSTLRLWSAFFVGLGVLAKGPVAAVLFLGIATV